MHIASGRAPISTSNRAKSSARRAPAMENSSPQSVNATKTTTDRAASTGTSARPIRIVASRVNVSTLAVRRCHASSATANWDGLARAATKVSESLSFLLTFLTRRSCRRRCRVINKVNRYRLLAVHDKDPHAGFQNPLEDNARAEGNRDGVGGERNVLGGFWLAAKEAHGRVQKFPSAARHWI
jgi:hypothetical protein